ncbi:MAG: protein kinase [Cyanosarcina radialis HA8281-LM2]|jgi:serine/threonine-protein kinase|nr:protein kinase [Cyanosarcina radialis HA8281-LM2]
MLGELLDRRYRITDNLGAGGFGETYIAEDTKLPGSPKCVVKHLKPFANDPHTLQVARRLFDSEAQVLQQLGAHAQIPQLLAYFEEKQEFFLVQQLVEGYPLSDELTPGKRLSESYAIALLQSILEPLSFVHEHNVIHRDIKPPNLIRRKSDGKIVLIDFGAVKEIAVTKVNTQGQSQLTVGIGTPGYMPSEQSRGIPRLSSDVYAVGIVGIQALTGLMPHELLEDPDTAEIIWRDRVQVNPMLGDLLAKMVRYDFRQRYKSAIEVLSELRSAIPATVVRPATTSISELTLEWVEAGQPKRVVIAENQLTKNPGTFRMGRDPATCDLVLSESTVSRLQAEIFFNAQQQRFYLRSLSQNNPPMVDGVRLLTGEVALHQGSNLRFGELDLRVVAIGLQQYPGGYTPTETSPPPTKMPSSPLPPTKPSSDPQEVQFPPPPVPPQYLQEVPDPPLVQPSPTLGVQGKSKQVGWRLFGWWVLANGVAIAASNTVFWAVSSAVSSAAVYGAVLGFGLGIVQWLVLRRLVGRAWQWVLANAVGGAVGSAVDYATNSAAVGAVGDAVAGAMGGAVDGATWGAITGGVLVWLLRNHRKSPK